MAVPLIVVGAGASGLAAAIAAGRLGTEVLVLEKKEQPLKKLLLTGNGRCNFTNLKITPDSYRSHDSAFPEHFLREFGTEDALSFFRELGLYPGFRGDYVYPMSMQAQSVRDALLSGIRSLPITVRTGVSVREITKDPKTGLFTVKCAEEEFRCRKIILSCGTPAGVRDREAYTADRILRALGHHVYPLKPALVKLLGQSGAESFWDGVRHHCIITLIRESDGRTFSEDGEVQFTKDGISGIPVFQLSHAAGEEIERRKKASLSLNLIPELSGGEMYNALIRLKNSPYHEARELRELLTGFLPKKLVRAVFAQYGELGQKKASGLSEQEIRFVSELLSAFPYEVTGTGDALSAQVMRGGADLSEFTENLESRLVPGLYVTGELLDIDGKCGGFNLHFAWGSGIRAGNSAGKDSGASL